MSVPLPWLDTDREGESFRSKLLEEFGESVVENLNSFNSGYKRETGSDMTSDRTSGSENGFVVQKKDLALRKKKWIAALKLSLPKISGLVAEKRNKKANKNISSEKITTKPRALITYEDFRFDFPQTTLGENDPKIGPRIRYVSNISKAPRSEFLSNAPVSRDTRRLRGPPPAALVDIWA